MVRPGAGQAVMTKAASHCLRGLTCLAAALTITGLVAGCSGSGHQSAPAAQAPAVPGQATAGPDLTGVQLPDFQMLLTNGGLSLPNPARTPGGVTTTDANVTCARPTHGVEQGIPPAERTAIYREYHLTAPAKQRKYVLDYLVPVDLGGTRAEANVWPAALRGTGFYEKVQTDHVLRDLVCRRAISLVQAQRDLEKNWYAAWLTYVVAADHP
jgi:hypothetical protein